MRARDFVPVSDGEIRSYRAAVDLALKPPVSRVSVDAEELARLLDEVERHRAIAAALVSDEPDSKYDAEIVEVRKNVRLAVERNRVPSTISPEVFNELLCAYHEAVAVRCGFLHGSFAPRRSMRECREPSCVSALEQVDAGRELWLRAVRERAEAEVRRAR